MIQVLKLDQLHGKADILAGFQLVFRLQPHIGGGDHGAFRVGQGGQVKAQVTVDFVAPAIETGHQFARSYLIFSDGVQRRRRNGDRLAGTGVDHFQVGSVVNATAKTAIANIKLHHLRVVAQWQMVWPFNTQYQFALVNLLLQQTTLDFS